LVGPWRLVFSQAAQKDARKLATAGLKEKTQALLELLREAPFRNPPRFEKLVGDLSAAYTSRISLQHRLVYQVLPDERVVKVLRMWTRHE
jgi:Txe/YoeB family toxin of toxin-antitoxin system